jgi:hypothetical protein
MVPRLAILAIVPAACWAAGAAIAQGASAPAAAGPSAAAASACERAARSTLNTSRADTVEVSFSAPVVAPGPADAAEVVLRGAGRARSSAGTRSFSYSCSFDTRSGEVVGVVLRDAQGAAPQPAVAVRSVEPDLSNLSPPACESAAAAALKQRWPRVSRIAFNAGTRTMEQDSLGNAALQGQGTAQPAPDAPSTHFTYTCAVDPRNGRVLATRITN